MPRYAILFHETPPGSQRSSHWDLMLEAGQCLRTWALKSLPAAQADVFAESLPDHRMAYLTYQGPVSGGRGHVSRWDAGEFQWLSQTSETLQIRVEGEQLVGTVRLTVSDAELGRWRLHYEPDAAGVEVPAM